MTTQITGTTGVSQIQDGTVTSAKIADGSVAQADLAQPLTRRTAQATTSGSSIDFTAIPSWAKRITIILDQISTNGAVTPLIRLGTGGALEVSGYVGAAFYANTTAVSNAAVNATGFDVSNSNFAAVTSYSGIFVLINISGNTWVINGQQGASGAGLIGGCSGSKTLAGVLDMVSIVLTSTAFDAGQITIMYEG